MKKLITGILLFVALAANAKPIAEVRVPDGYVQLRSEACTAPAVVAYIKPELVRHFHRADVRWQGKDFAACWIEQPDFIFIVDETGSNGAVPKETFRAPGVGV